MKIKKRLDVLLTERLYADSRSITNDSVHSLKSEARYLTQLKGIVLKNLYALCSEMLIDLCCRCRRYVEGGE